MIYDLIIIGLGPAGISAAIYAKRAGIKILGLESEAPGGLLNKINAVDNYPGYKHVMGPDLAFQMYEQINDLGVEYKIKKVTNIEVNGDIKRVYCNEEVFETKNIIIATGRKAKKLGLKNENKFVGKGVSYCATCDGALYKGKDVAVVGGGNSAIEEALYLANIVNKVYLIHRRDEFRAEQELVDNLKDMNNIEILYNRTVTELVGEKNLEKIVLDDGKELEVSCLFTYVGYEPYSDFLSDLSITDEKGYIKVDENYQTSIKGIYAVGDAILKKVYQIVTATSEGAIAALEVAKRVKKG